MEITKGTTSGPQQEQVSCPSCATTFQVLKPMEGLIYTCKKCEAQFMLRKQGSRFETFMWSEDEILKKLLEVPGQSGPSQLQRLWKKVFNNLEDENAHREFVQLCLKLNQRDMAREKYNQLKSYLNWTQIPADVKEMLYPTPKQLSPWQERMPWILIGLGVAFILAGIIMPQNRNMFGAGVLIGLLTTIFYRKQILSNIQNQNK